MDLLEGSPGDYAPVLANVRAASLNCYTYEAEVCRMGWLQGPRGLPAGHGCPELPLGAKGSTLCGKKQAMEHLFCCWHGAASGSAPARMHHFALCPPCATGRGGP